MRSAPLRIAALGASILSLSLFVPSHFVAAQNSSWKNSTEAGVFVRRFGASSEAVCSEASASQAAQIRLRDTNAPLAVLPQDPSPSALRIVLRGTTQLQSFPPARNAFIRAAAQWESVIQTPITVVV